MQLHEISLPKHKRAQRIGRSGKRGSYSGRGIKGQKSRAGRRIRPASRDLIQRLPKMRGYRNPGMPKPLALNLADLSKLEIAQGMGPLNVLKLKELNLVPRRYNGPVKLLGTGEIGFALIVSGLKVSKSAEAKIVKAGGRVEKTK